MQRERDEGQGGGVKVEPAQLFPFYEQVSALDDEAMKESAYAPLFFSVDFSPSFLPLGHDRLLFQLRSAAFSPISVQKT